MDGKLISRRTLLGSAAAAGLIRPAFAQAPVPAVTTGVTPIFIRWDAWYATGTAVNAYHNMLSPQKWQGRAPWFSQVVSPYRIIATGTQANMDTEILAAANAGIKAWAFDWYGAGTGSPPQPPGSPTLNGGWPLYNASPYKEQVKWCLLLQGSKNLGYNPWSNTAGWQANVNQLVGYFQQTNYLKVGGRPVIFLLWETGDVATYFAGNNANVTTAWNYLRSQSTAAPGAGNPYAVALGSPWVTGTGSSSDIKTLINGDAISHYVPKLLPSKLPNSAADMYAENQTHWATQLATGNKLVPNAITGWDKRPLNELPQYGSATNAWIGNLQYYTHPTNAQLATYLQGCIDFIGANAAACETKMMLVYSWSECAEGGKAAMPTIGDPPTGSPPTTNLLSAIKPVLTAAA